jgi:hypothetical protein
MPSNMPGGFQVPSYLPPIALPVVPWTKHHVARLAKAPNLNASDLWDEAVTALLRATVYYDPASGPFPPYARTSVHRACWRYVVRGARRLPPHLPYAPELDALEASPEAILLALEAAASRLPEPRQTRAPHAPAELPRRTRAARG